MDLCNKLTVLTSRLLCNFNISLFYCITYSFKLIQGCSWIVINTEILNSCIDSVMLIILCKILQCLIGIFKQHCGISVRNLTFSVSWLVFSVHIPPLLAAFSGITVAIVLGMLVQIIDWVQSVSIVASV